jgi:hypothetical protein
MAFECTEFRFGDVRWRSVAKKDLEARARFHTVAAIPHAALAQPPASESLHRMRLSPSVASSRA